MVNKVKLSKIYYVLLIIFIINDVFSESQLVNFSGISVMLTVVRYLDLGILVVAIFYRNMNVKKNIIMLFGIISIFIIFNLLIEGSGLSLLPILLFTLMSRDYSLEKIFKITIVSLLAAHLLVIMCTWGGLLEDNIGSRYIGYSSSLLGGHYQRHSMGFLVHNQIPLFFMIIYFYIILYKRENIKFIENIFFVVSNYFIFSLFGARIVFILVFVVFGGYYVIKIANKFDLKIFSVPWHLSYPILAFFSYVVFFKYDENNRMWVKLNLFFNNRIEFAHKALKHYGIKLIGSGKNLVGNTVDNGYLNTMLINGVIVCVLLIGIWTYITWIAEKKNNRYLVFILVILAFENLINTHLESFKLIPLFCILVNPNDPFLDTSFNEKIIKKQKHLFRRIKFLLY